MGESRKPDWTPAEAAANWINGKTSEDFSILESEDGRQSYAEVVNRRNAKGDLESVRVRVWPPDPLDKAKARVDALEWVQQIAKLDARPTWTSACELLGETYVDQLDTVCLLARCIRDHDDPNHQHLAYDELLRRYRFAPLMELWEKLDYISVLQDPRANELGEEDFWRLVDGIDKAKNVGPLAAISGRARDSCVLTMACLLAASRRNSSSSPSTATS